MTWLQEHYSVRYSWIWLLPVFHLLTGTLELTTQGSVINDDSWWGIDQLKRIVTSHQKTFPDEYVKLFCVSNVVIGQGSFCYDTINI